PGRARRSVSTRSSAARPPRITLTSTPSRSRPLGDHAELPRDLVVVASRVGRRIGALEHVAKVARIQRERLVVAGADRLAVAGVVPSGATIDRHIALAGERVRAAGLPRQPRAIETVGDP